MDIHKPSSIPFAIRLPVKDRQALERAAKADDRPTASLARKIIQDWLRRQEKRA